MRALRDYAVEDFAQCVLSLPCGGVFCVHEMHVCGGGEWLVIDKVRSSQCGAKVESMSTAGSKRRACSARGVVLL